MLERRAGSLEPPPTKGAHRFLTSWTIVLVSMIAWHVLTALRHLVLTPEDQGLGLLVLSEEVILMIVTILATIWNLSSKTRTLAGLVVTPICCGLGIGLRLGVHRVDRGPHDPLRGSTHRARLRTSGDQAGPHLPAPNGIVRGLQHHLRGVGAQAHRSRWPAHELRARVRVRSSLRG